MQEKGQKEYTAKDYAAQNGIQLGGEAARGMYNQAMKNSNADSLVEFRKKVFAFDEGSRSRNEIYYRFIGNQGTPVHVAHDDIKHAAGKHNLTDEQLDDLEKKYPEYCRLSS